MKRLKVVYVAGPFRGDSHWDIEQNIRRAEELSLKVWRMGHVGLCPHTNTRFFQNAAPDHIWLEGDLELLRRCDAILFTPDWARSSGASKERELAEALKMPMFFSIDELASWKETPFEWDEPPTQM